MQIGHLQKTFCSRSRGSRFPSSFKAVNNLSFYVTRRDPGNHRPNGAGKTTVLDLICGKTKRVGSIQFRGKGVTKLRRIRSPGRIAEVPDSVDL